MYANIEWTGHWDGPTNGIVAIFPSTNSNLMIHNKSLPIFDHMPWRNQSTHCSKASAIHTQWLHTVGRAILWTLIGYVSMLAHVHSKQMASSRPIVPSTSIHCSCLCDGWRCFHSSQCQLRCWSWSLFSSSLKFLREMCKCIWILCAFCSASEPKSVFPPIGLLMLGQLCNI